METVQIVKGGLSMMPRVPNNKYGLVSKVKYSKDLSNENKVITSMKAHSKKFHKYLIFKKAIINHKPHSRFSFVALIFDYDFTIPINNLWPDVNVIK